MQPSEPPGVVKLADGRVVTKDGKVGYLTPVPNSAARVSQEIMNGGRARKTLERLHRRLGDLPSDDPKKLNPIAAVITYTALGLSDADIATALGATPEQIGVLKESDIYNQLSELFDQGTFEDARRNAKHILARASDLAADRMVGLIGSGDDSLALAASRDVMKFNGLSTDQTNEKRVSGLHIKIVRGGEKKDEDEITVEIGS